MTRPVAGPPPATWQMMTAMLRTAIMAPSPQGTQPWHYQVHLASQTIDLYADAERARRYGEPTGRTARVTGRRAPAGRRGG